MTLRKIEQQNCIVTLNTNDQILHIDEDEERFDRRLLPKIEFGNFQFIPASTLIMKAKQFDDGLYAAVELLVQNGTASFLGKRYLLGTLAAQLMQPSSDAETIVASNILAACQLGKVDINVSPALRDSVCAALDSFLGNPWLSKPISFYTWSPALEQIFQQDRLLQKPLPKLGVSKVINSLRADSQLRRAYIELIELTAKLTNQHAAPSLTRYIMSASSGQPEDDLPFSPPSISPETELVKKLYGNSPIPDGFSLIDEVISRLKSGQLNLKPSPESGWYDHVLWSLVPLVRTDKMPESKKIVFGSKYKELLLDLFKGAYCLARETHIKQLEMAMAGCMPVPKIYVSPQLNVEPLPTFYYRRAQSYKFVENVLVSTLGEEALKQARRLTAEGQVDMDLHSELKYMQSLFYGAHVLAGTELGLEPAALAETDAPGSLKLFQRWNPCADADLRQDARCMVPVFYDQERKAMKVWVFLGWRQKDLVITYKVPPKIVETDLSRYQPPAWGRQDSKPEIEFCGDRPAALYPAMVELYVDAPMNRKEFVAHCDRYETEAEILQGLRSATPR